MLPAGVTSLSSLRRVSAHLPPSSDDSLPEVRHSRDIARLASERVGPHDVPQLRRRLYSPCARRIGERSVKP